MISGYVIQILTIAISGKKNICFITLFDMTMYFYHRCMATLFDICFSGNPV